jgi:hypothetical protein
VRAQYALCLVQTISRANQHQRLAAVLVEAVPIVASACQTNSGYTAENRADAGSQSSSARGDVRAEHRNSQRADTRQPPAETTQHSAGDQTPVASADVGLVCIGRVRRVFAEGDEQADVTV